MAARLVALKSARRCVRSLAVMLPEVASRESSLLTVRGLAEAPSAAIALNASTTHAKYVIRRIRLKIISPMLGSPTR